MLRKRNFFGTFCCIFASVLSNQVQQTAASDLPNVMIVIADDLGYSDLGCYGSEIATPNLDRLAAHGLRFTQFSNTARCWPTRSALMAGYYAQQIRRDEVKGIVSGGKGVRPSWAKLLPSKLSTLGYRSYHSGKWHVDGTPLEGGFDRSYNLIDHRFFAPRRYTKDDKPQPPIDPQSGYYSTIATADYAIECLKDHAQNYNDRPFFQYLAFHAPHFPLHALPEDIERYQNTYRSGWEVLRQSRWKKQLEMGLVRGKLSEVETDIGPPYDFPEDIAELGPGEVNRPVPWGQLTAEQQAFQSTKMAIHAAMIDRLDRELGRVLDQLKSMNAIENTLIFFLSDNGASAEIMVRDGGHDPMAPPGSADSYLCLGPGWSSVSNTPFRRHKTWVHLGGVTTPLVVHWPRGIKGKGELRTNPGHVIDLLPTVLDVAGVPISDIANEKIPLMPGKSLVPCFDTDLSVHHDFLWWLHEGNRAIRVGDWRLVAAKNEAWELFNLAVDPNETDNLASKHSERVLELADFWQKKYDEFAADARRE